MATMQVYGCISRVYISFQVLYRIAFRRMPASTLGFLVGLLGIDLYFQGQTVETLLNLRLIMRDGTSITIAIA